MKFNYLFEEYLHCSNESEVFQYFQDTLTDSITGWNYFVNWQKVLSQFRAVEINLNTLNYLIGKEDIEKSFRDLLQQSPQIICVIPILIACRTYDFQILTNYKNNNFNYKTFNFKNKTTLSIAEIDDIVEFVKNTGILELFKNKTLKSIPDYVLGIEVGLDTNGRKNRGGTTMETIVENVITTICQENDFVFMPQATSDKIKKQWNIDLEVDKSSRRFDFAVKNDSNLYLIKANFYSGGGSKLNATAGEYKSLFNFISRQGHQFIWITDGLGWKKTLHPLEETFKHIDYTLNLKMVVDGFLGELIAQKM
jgi:type II restriction enzyme